MPTHFVWRKKTFRIFYIKIYINAINANHKTNTKILFEYILLAEVPVGSRKRIGLTGTITSQK